MVGVITLACVLYWCVHFHRFVVPASDTVTYVKTARELWDGELPSRYQRMPLFPALIGLVGKFIPAEEPELEAGLVVNLLFSAGALLLLYSLARRITGWSAIVPVALMAVSTETHNSAGQPLLEPMLGFMVLLCIWLYVRRSRWLHVALFFCALTRYECAGLIAVVFVVDAISQRRLWRPLLLAAAASSGFLVWMILSVQLGGTRAGNQYLDEMQSYGWHINPSFLVRAFHASFQRTDLAEWSIAAAVGVVAAWWRDRTVSAVILGFFALYVLAHVAFPVPLDRYVYPVRWVLPLYAGLGAEAVIDRVESRVRSQIRPWDRYLLVAVAALVAVRGVRVFARNVVAIDGVMPSVVYVVFPAVVLVAVFVYAVLARRPFWAGVALALVLVGVLGRQAGRGIRYHGYGSWRQYYNQYESYLAGKWLADHLATGEKALVTHLDMTVRCGKLDGRRLVGFNDLTSPSIDELPAELAARGVVYVVYQYYRLPEKSSSMYPVWKRRYQPHLLDPFATGEPVPGFEHVITLPIPERANRDDVQIYRVAPP